MVHSHNGEYSEQPCEMAVKNFSVSGWYWIAPCWSDSYTIFGHLVSRDVGLMCTNMRNMEWIRVPTATMLTVYLLLTGKLYSDNDSMGQGSMFLNFHNGRLYVLCLWIYTKATKDKFGTRQCCGINCYEHTSQLVCLKCLWCRDVRR
jgi:hypothetical protein